MPLPHPHSPRLDADSGTSSGSFDKAKVASLPSRQVSFLADDELVEITPSAIRLRKRHLKEHERKKAARGLA